MKIYLGTAAAVLFLLCGCLWSPYRETVYYDIMPADSVPEQSIVYQVTDFRNCSGAGSRFQYKNADGQIVSDPDCKWLMQPGALVARAIRLSLTAPSKTTGITVKNADAVKQFYVRGELLTFETDLEKMEFVLHAKIRVVSPGAKEHLLDCSSRIPLQDIEPGTISRAAGIAVSEIVNQLKKVR
ncbi:MAG: hypothetical protein IJC34_06080 [Lentisphaeria bacterium]|nr:hypothetical protein [Lentisphaeria bacterium]